MAPTLAQQTVAKRKDTMWLKTACKDLERLESAANVVPKIRPMERLDRAAPC